MNTRRKFLQMAGLYTATSVVAKSANAFHKNLSIVENKLLGKSLRAVSILHSGRITQSISNNEKIMVVPNLVADEITADTSNMVIKMYQKGLVKTGVIYCQQPQMSQQSPTKNYLQSICNKAVLLKKEEKCQIVVVYVNMEMPDAKKIVDKDFWLAQMHDVDVLFTNADKKKNFSRICQDKDRKELIVAPLHNEKNNFGGIDFLFDVGLNKSAINFA